MTQKNAELYLAIMNSNLTSEVKEEFTKEYAILEEKSARYDEIMNADLSEAMELLEKIRKGIYTRVINLDDITIINAALLKLQMIENANQSDALTAIKELASYALDEWNEGTPMSIKLERDYDIAEAFVLKSQKDTMELAELKDKLNKLFENPVYLAAGRINGKSEFASIMKEIEDIIKRQEK